MPASINKKFYQQECFVEIIIIMTTMRYTSHEQNATKVRDEELQDLLRVLLMSFHTSCI
jgi:hypothetical protein